MVPRTMGPFTSIVKWKVAATTRSVQLGSVQDDIYALGKAHMPSSPSLRSFPTVTFEVFTKFVWLATALSCRHIQYPAPTPLLPPLGVATRPRDKRKGSTRRWISTFQRLDNENKDGSVPKDDLFGALVQNQNTRELISTQTTSHKHNKELSRLR